MTVMDVRLEEKLRQSFKYLNRFMVLMWRLGLGRWLNLWPEVGGRIMVITHTGRKTGLKRYTPVNYALVDGGLYCVAAFGAGADWYRNIMATTEVEVWLPDGWWVGVVHDISEPSPERLSIIRQVLISSGFAAPLFGLHPRTMTDETLDAATAHYRLIHIQCITPCTGAGGPGDLAWIWPLATMILLPLALLRRRRNQLLSD